MAFKFPFDDYIYKSIRVSLTLAVAVLAIAWTGLLEPIERMASDVMVRLASEFPPEPSFEFPDVALVEIYTGEPTDDSPATQSFDGLARAVRRLEAAGAKAIAIDLDMDGFRAKLLTPEFVRVVEQSGRVVLGVNPAIASGDWLAGLANQLAEPNTVLASTQLGQDASGVTRLLSEVERDLNASPEQPLPVAASLFRVAVPRIPMRVEWSIGAIDYRRARPGFPKITMNDLLDGRFDPSSVAGRVVLVGAVPGTVGETAYETPLGGTESSLVLHAYAYRTWVAAASGSSVPGPPSRWQGWAVAALISVALALVVRLALPWRITALVVAGLGVAIGFLAWVLAAGSHATPVTSVIVLAAHGLLATDRARQRFRLKSSSEDLSIAVVARVCEAATRLQPTGDRDLRVPLAILGEAVGASGVSLLCGTGVGGFQEALNWRPGLPDPFCCPQVGSASVAVQVATSETVEFCDATDAVFGSAGYANSKLLYVPLRCDDGAVGVLIVEGRKSRPFSDLELKTIAGTAAQLALVLRNASLLDDLKITFTTAWTALSRAVEARDGYTELHTPRMVAFAKAVAGRLGLSGDEVAAVELGALLHDVGKIGIRDSVLNKPSPFTPDERRDMERHPVIGADLVGSIHGLPTAVVQCIRHHHESWDGNGYPDGIAGQDIPLSARIVCVVDVWDAMMSARPYKSRGEPESVVDHFGKYSGVRFDPEIVDVFLSVLEEFGDEVFGVDGVDGEPARDSVRVAGDDSTF